MTVQAIRLENFMAFRDTGWIELRPITLLFGRNSTGKSAIIRALRLLRQSIVNNREGQPLIFITEDGVNLGSFRKVLHQDEASDLETEGLMKFHFRCRLSPDILEILRVHINEWRERYNQPSIAYKDMIGWLNFSLGFAEHEKTRNVELVQIAINCPGIIGEGFSQNVFLAEKISPELIKDQLSKIDNQSELIEIFENWYSQTGDWHFESDFLFDQEETQEQNVFSWSQVSVTSNNSFLPKLIYPRSVRRLKKVPNTEFDLVNKLLGSFEEVITEFLENLEYLGPIRPNPQWIYFLDEINQFQWRRKGWASFLDFLLDILNFKELTTIDGWLSYLDLGSYKINDNKREDTKKGVPLSQIEICESQKANHPRNISLVGYGISQVLPIIVQSVMSKTTTEQRMIIIEQPELHLHPRAQTNLADVFIDAIYQATQVQEYPSEYEHEVRNVIFLLETHSEHLLLRLRRRIAETLAKKNDEPIDLNEFLKGINQFLQTNEVSVYLVDRDYGVSHIDQLLINKCGEFESIPEGFKNFFSDDLREVAKLTQARIEADELSSHGQ